MTSKYPIFLCPGPTNTPKERLAAYGEFLGSSDLEKEYNTLYDKAEELLKKMFNAPEDSSAIIMSGEGMLALWAGLSSTLNAGDRVLAINNGVYGKGIGEMAEGKGAEVQYIDFPPDQPPTLSLCQPGGSLYLAVHQFKPKLITFVHCETPTGVVIPEEVINEIGALAKSENALVYADMVSSAGGVAIDLTKNKVDLAMIGTQKCFSLPPDLSIIIVSADAWRVIKEKESNPKTRYIGYDSIFQFHDPVVYKDAPGRIFPYTMHWNATAALVNALEDMLAEGDELYRRHNQIAELFRTKARELGYRIFPLDDRYSSPTVTALYLPANTTFEAFDHKLREKGVVIGGSYGDFEGKLFRVGHMGSQANHQLIDQFISILKDLSQ